MLVLDVLIIAEMIELLMELFYSNMFSVSL